MFVSQYAAKQVIEATCNFRKPLPSIFPPTSWRRTESNMLSLLPFFTLVLAVCGIIDAKSSTGDSVLVIVDPAQKNDYSIFFDGLKGMSLSALRGRNLTPLQTMAST